MSVVYCLLFLADGYPPDLRCPKKPVVVNGAVDAEQAFADLLDGDVCYLERREKGSGRTAKE